MKRRRCDPKGETTVERPPTGVRVVDARDLPAVIDLDERVTGVRKPEHFQNLFDALGSDRQPQRFFLVIENEGGGGKIDGFTVGEVREWEFGSRRCGWITAIAVEPGIREKGVATRLFEAIADAFRRAGADTIRTLPPRGNRTVVSFFRSQGMMAGPSIELEKKLT